MPLRGTMESLPGSGGKVHPERFLSDSPGDDQWWAGLWVSKIKDRHQVADCWTVGRDIGIIGGRDRVGQIVATPRRQRREAPVFLDELQDRSVVGIDVVDRGRLDVWRNHEHRNPGPIAEEIERLDIAGVVVAAALVERDYDRG